MAVLLFWGNSLATDETRNKHGREKQKRRGGRKKKTWQARASPAQFGLLFFQHPLRDAFSLGTVNQPPL
jgi:hypothetical protein